LFLESCAISTHNSKRGELLPFASIWASLRLKVLGDIHCGQTEVIEINQFSCVWLSLESLW
jgi:hypothetical protein